MNDTPDLCFDIDALFQHMIENLGHDIKDEKEWNFKLRAKDFHALEAVAEELDGEFLVQLQEHVEVIDTDDQSISLGDPLLSVSRQAALTPDEVKAIAQRLQSLAKKRGLIYEGVDCYDPVDAEELFGWLAPDDAVWRLRHMSDCGLEENADLPWAFLVNGTSLKKLKNIASQLAKKGFDDVDIFDEPDDDGSFALCVFVSGRNNEAEFVQACNAIHDVAEQNDGQLQGVQFYTREEMYEVFSEEDDEE